MKILFCNIGWMKEYNGQTDIDKLINGGKYVKENNYGAEEFNFQNINGYYYGYVSHMHQMRIERLEGINKSEDVAENVLVVWVAKDNRESNKIIGWYKNATIYRDFQTFSRMDPDLNRDRVFYRMKANVFDSTLLPVSKRTFKIPRASVAKDGIGMGQSNIWYADEEKCKPFVEKVFNYIDNYCGEIQNKISYKLNLSLKSEQELDKYEDYLDKADELMNINRDLEALSYINKLLSIKENDTNGYNYKGIILSKLGFYDQAIKYYKKSLETYKSFSNPVLNIGKALGYKGKEKCNFEKALEYFEKYIELEEDDADGFDCKGFALFYLSRFEEAEACFKKSYELQPDDEWYEFLCEIIINNKIESKI